jgi:hypothetical protein
MHDPQPLIDAGMLPGGSDRVRGQLAHRYFYGYE